MQRSFHVNLAINFNYKSLLNIFDCMFFHVNEMSVGSRYAEVE